MRNTRPTGPFGDTVTNPADTLLAKFRADMAAAARGDTAAALRASRHAAQLDEHLTSGGNLPTTWANPPAQGILDFDTPTAPPIHHPASETAAAAINRAGNAADPAWTAAARTALLVAALTRPNLTTDHVWDQLAHTTETTAERRAMGAIIRYAATRGWIERTNQTEQTDRAAAHKRPVAVWRSLVHAPVYGEPGNVERAVNAVHAHTHDNPDAATTIRSTPGLHPRVTDATRH